MDVVDVVHNKSDDNNDDELQGLYSLELEKLIKSNNSIVIALTHDTDA